MPRVGTVRWGLSVMRMSVEYTLSGPPRGPPDCETSGCASGFFLCRALTSPPLPNHLVNAQLICGHVVPDEELPSRLRQVGGHQGSEVWGQPSS